MSLVNNIRILTSLKVLAARLQSKRHAIAWASVLSLGLVAACSQPSGLSSLHELHDRVTYTLDIELAPLTFSVRPPELPAPRVLKPVHASTTMSFLTALQLNHCRAGQIIAERNSSLGRLDDGLSRFYDDQRLIEALLRCSQDPQSEAFSDELVKAAQQLDEQTATRLARAIATDKGLRNVMTMASTPLTTISDQDFSHSMEALNTVIAWLHNPRESTELTAALQVLAQQDYIPKLMRSVAEATALLDQFTPQLDDLAKHAGCLSKGTPERARRLHQAFITVFIKQTQADLADLQRQYQRVSEAFNRLAALVPQAELTDYLMHWTAYNTRLPDTTKAFVQPWQQFFETCGFQAGR